MKPGSQIKGLKAEFEQSLEFEKTLSEYKRVKLFTYILAIGTILGFMNYFFDAFSLSTITKNTTTNLAITLCVPTFLLYEIFTLYRIKNFIKKGRSIPESLRTFHVLIEILLPGVMILLMMEFEHRPVFLDAPFVFMYFMLIAISALQLNFKASFLLGLCAGLQYAALTYYAFTYLQPISDMKLTIPQSIYYLRAFLMVVTGAASGLIAHEINKRVQNSFKQLDEKQKIINLFGQQVSKEIVDELIKRKDEFNIQRNIATIMFLDIRNFSTYAETKDPAEIIQFQNNIFNPLIEIITKHHGIVNQFMGDGFMASFGIPLSHNQHVQNAYDAGVEIIDKINDLGEKSVIPKTRVGIGLHCGEVITGNIGNDIRKQYSIAGTTVITSARLEQMNKQFKTQFLITKEVLQQIDLHGQKTESLGETAVKGFEKPLEVICVRV